MPEPTCTHIKPNGHPCAARPLPGRTLCLFHDPAYAHAQAEARAKGGAAPRRQTRRYPRLLDHYHIAELLGELFVDALNHADPTNPKCLNALTAVGTPDDQYLEEQDRSEPAPTEDHLLRLYPAPPAEAEPLPAGGQPLAAAPTSDPSHPSDLPDPSSLPAPERLNARTPERLNPEQDPNRPGTHQLNRPLPPIRQPSDAAPYPPPACPRAAAGPCGKNPRSDYRRPWRPERPNA